MLMHTKLFPIPFANKKSIPRDYQANNDDLLQELKSKTNKFQTLNFPNQPRSIMNSQNVSLVMELAATGTKHSEYDEMRHSPVGPSHGKLISKNVYLSNYVTIYRF